MFVPLHDNTPLRMIRFQFVTGTLVVTNLVIYAMMVYGGFDMSHLQLATAFGLVPAEIGQVVRHTAGGAGWVETVREPLTLITYTFIHGGWLHVISNMAFMWVFADNVEDAFGHIGFLLLYFVCGIIAAGAHIVANPDSTIPLVGASGAVSGILGSYIVLFPRARVWVLLFMKLPLRISALWALAGWIGFQVLSLYVDDGQNEVLVAWWAHIGGFAAGFIITVLFRRTLAHRLA